MKRALAAALAVLSLAALSAPRTRQKPADPMAALARLYEECRTFELRDAMPALEDYPSADMEFFRGAVDQAFNRLDSAVSRLRSFLLAVEKRPARRLTKEAWAALACSLCRLGRYREGAEAFRNVLDRFGNVLDKDEKTACEGQFALWSALNGVPPQTVEIASDTIIPMKDRQFPVCVGDRVISVGYDTGSSLSVLYESAAGELGVRIYGPRIRIQTGTGAWIESGVAVVPEMRLGAIVIRNAVFFVLPDKMFARASGRPGADRRGLLGIPVLAAFKEFTETRRGELIIPAHPGPRPRQNMCFSGFLPIVEALHRGTRLSFCLDTGSATTHLFPPFYRRYYGEISEYASLRESLVGGVGGTRKVRVRIMNELRLKAGGRDISLRNVFVHVDDTHAETKDFHGTLGIDVLAGCARLTCNFESMSFILE